MDANETAFLRDLDQDMRWFMRNVIEPDMRQARGKGMDKFDRLEKLLERIADATEDLAGSRLDNLSDAMQRIALAQQDIKIRVSHMASLMQVQNLHDEISELALRLQEIETSVACIHARVFDGVSSTDTTESIDFDPFLPEKD